MSKFNLLLSIILDKYYLFLISFFWVKNNFSTPKENSTLRLLGAAKSEGIFKHLLKTLKFLGQVFWPSF